MTTVNFWKSDKKRSSQELQSILAKNIRIPEWWSKPNVPEEERFSRTKLIERRKLEKIPHASYDIDGDGYVGGRDYIIAKHFDKDQDGRLNTQEKKNAIEALKNV